MPRNSSGTFSQTGNPFVSGTTISSTEMNAKLADVAAEITDSLSRSGKGGASAPLRTPDGTKAAPAHAFNSETGSGLYRAGAGDVRVAVLGSDVARFVPGSVDAPGTNAALTLRGNKADSDAGTDVVLNSQATRTAGNLLAVQNNGMDKVLVGYDGKVTSASLVSGSLTLGSGGTISPNSGTFSITGLAAPTNPDEATNKAYVDGLAVGTPQTSGSSGAFSTSSASSVDVTNLSVTITTRGRPVVLGLVPDGSVNVATLFVSDANSAIGVLALRNASTIGRWQAGNSASAGFSVPVGSVLMLDAPGAGTYTYKIQVWRSVGTGNVTLQYAKLVAYEL